MTVDDMIRLYEDGKHKRAYVCCQRQLEWNPDDPFALFYAGLILQGNGQYRDALTVYRRLLRVSPKEPLVFNNIGVIHHLRGDDTKALAGFTMELKLHPACREAHHNKAEILVHRRRYAQALPHIRHCLRSRYKEDVMIDWAATCLCATKQLKEEIRVYRAFLRRYPDNAWVLNNLGAALIDAGQYTQALTVLRAATKHGSDADGCTGRNIAAATTELQRQRTSRRSNAGKSVSGKRTPADRTHAVQRMSSKHPTAGGSVPVESGSDAHQPTRPAERSRRLRLRTHVPDAHGLPMHRFLLACIVDDSWGFLRFLADGLIGLIWGIGRLLSISLLLGVSSGLAIRGAVSVGFPVWVAVPLVIGFALVVAWCIALVRVFAILPLPPCKNGTCASGRDITWERGRIYGREGWGTNRFWCRCGDEFVRRRKMLLQVSPDGLERPYARLVRWRRWQKI